MVLIHLIFLLCTTIRPNNNSSLIYFFYPHTTIRSKNMVLFHSLFCTRPFDQDLGSSLIYLFYARTTIRPKFMVLFHLFFLLCTTIRPKIRVLIDLFLLFARDHSTKIYGPLSFILSLMHNHSTKNQGLHFHTTILQKYMIFFLSFVLPLCTTVRPKIWVFVGNSRNLQELSRTVSISKWYNNKRLMFCLWTCGLLCQIQNQAIVYLRLARTGLIFDDDKSSFQLSCNLLCQYYSSIFQQYMLM